MENENACKVIEKSTTVTRSKRKNTHANMKSDNSEYSTTTTLDSAVFSKEISDSDISNDYSGDKILTSLKERVIEKKQFSNLNSRLANYIDHIHKYKLCKDDVDRSFQIDNSQIDILKSEIDNSKCILNEVQTEYVLLNSKMDDQLEINRKLENVCKKLKEKNIKLEESNTDLQLNVNDLTKMIKKNKIKMENINDSFSEVTMNYSDLNKRYDSELRKRILSENELTTLKEKVNTSELIHKKQLDESKLLIEFQMESMNDYNDKVNTSFVEQIDELRSYSEQTMNEMRRHQHDVFEKKFNGLFEVFNKYCDTTETNRKHVKNLKKSVQAEIKDNINLKSRIKALEKQLYVLEQDKIENDLNGDKIIDLKNEEINVLKQTISEQINEYNNILEINASMSNDLNLYKSMLESEECRLGISYKPGEKRKRNGQLNGTHSMIDFSFKNDFNILSSNRENFVYLHSGSLSIKHVNQMGWFVSIENCSSDQINLSGYQLKQYNSEKSVIYSFKDKKLLPEQILNIWSFNDIPNIKCDKLNVKFDEGGWIQFSQEDKINFVLLDKSNTEISLAYASKHPSFKKMDDLDRKKCSVM